MRVAVDFVKTLLRKNSTTVLIVLSSILFILFHIVSLGDSIYWWTPDSVEYIEAARNYSDTKQLLISTDIYDLNKTAPFRLWPPGYPLLLSLIQDITGIDAQWISVIIPIISWVLIPLIIFVFIRPLLGGIPSALLSILVLTSPAVTEFGWKGLTDVPFLLIIVLGLFFSCRLNSGWQTTLSVFVGGVVLGVAYSIRTVGAAALAAVFLVYAMYFLVKRDERRKVLVRIIAWGTGAATVVIPLFIRNIITFGTLQPYNMPPSTVSLLRNIKIYIFSTVYDLLGARLEMLVGWDFVFFIVAATVTLVAYTFYQDSDPFIKNAHNLINEFRSLSPSVFIIITLSIYSVLGASIVIYARTTYQWGEQINLRQVMQYDWALMAILCFILFRFIDRNISNRAVYLFCSVLILAHLYNAAGEHYLKESKGIGSLKFRVYSNEDIRKEIIKLSEESRFVASNFHDVLRMTTSVPIHRLYLKQDENLEHDLRETLSELSKTLAGTGKQGHIFLFLDKSEIDHLMAGEKFSMEGLIIERRNENLLTFEMFPDQRDQDPQSVVYYPDLRLSQHLHYL